jgi:valyl-tRNA synthetase
MGLIAGRVAAVNRGYDRRRVEEARNFANKLWNIARYVEGAIENTNATRIILVESQPQSIADHWILNKLAIAAKKISEHLESYRLSEAYETIYHFVWDELADWYVEASKTDLNQPFLAYVLESTLKLAHPFAPFVTETIWQTLAWKKDDLLISQRWPKIPRTNEIKVNQFEEVRELVSEVRRISTILGLKKLRLTYRNAPIVEENKQLIAQMAKLAEIVQNDNPSGLKLTLAHIECWLEVSKEAVKSYLIKLERDKIARQKAVEALESRLANKSYIMKAPKELVAESRVMLETEKAKIAQIEEDIAIFTKAAS